MHRIASHRPQGLELGNEQNDKYTGAMTAADFAILYNLTLELWPDAAARPGLYGPDPHSLHDASGSQLNWIAEFLDGCAKLGVPMRGVTHHEYTEVDPTVEGFTAAATLAKNGAIAAAINATVRAHNSVAGIFGGEIGPHNGGSPPCDHTSMRWAVFGDSLWYADALAAKAKNGCKGPFPASLSLSLSLYVAVFLPPFPPHPGLYITAVTRHPRSRARGRSDPA